jgi:hypothetical protein
LYDSFNPPDPTTLSPFISYAEIDLAYGQSGTFTLTIHDPDEKLDTTKIGLGNRVWIQAGRDPDHLFNLFSGVCRTFQPIRAGYNLLTYKMAGFGTQVIFNERVVNFLRQSIRRTDNPNRPFFDDPNMKAYLLFKELCEKTDIIPTVHPAIKHTLYPGMFNTTDLIDPAVDTFIASITEPYVEASQVANNIADMAGAVWGVEPGSPSTPDKVFLRFPSTVHSGILIKDRPEPEDPDEPTSTNVSYLTAKTGFNYTDSMKKEDGFTSKPFSKTGADIATGSTSQGDQNGTPLLMIDIAQQFTVNSTQLRDLAFTIHVDGMGELTPASQKPYDPGNINFRIVNDDNGRPGPSTELRSSFPIPSTLASGQPQNIFLQLPQAHQLTNLKPGDKAWVIFFNECVILYPEDGSADACGQGVPDLCAAWHHDGGTSGISAIRTVCQPRGSAGARSPTFDDTASGWVVNAAGPTYSHTFFDSFSHIVEAADQESIEKYGEVDSFIDANWITDEDTMSSFLGSFIQYAAKPRRIYEMSEVYIPYLSPIQPGQLVTVVDTKSALSANKNTIAEVQEVRYEFSAESAGRTPLGTNVCEVRLLGYVDYKESMVLMHQQEVLELPVEPPGGPGSPPVQPPTQPPTQPPPGQVGPYASTGRQLGATTRRATRHYASGKPDDETIEKNTTNIPYAHYQCVYFVTMHGIEHDDNVSSKLGGTHMGSGWHDHGVSFNSGRTCLGTEPNHPNTNACIKTGPSIGSIIEKRIGICTIWRKPSKHTELWTKVPGGNWIKQLENTGSLGGFTPNNSGNDEAQLRIDGFEDGDDPTIDIAMVQEISPG